jgi:hypothetical protein
MPKKRKNFTRKTKRKFIQKPILESLFRLHIVFLFSLKRHRLYLRMIQNLFVHHSSFKSHARLSKYYSCCAHILYSIGMLVHGTAVIVCHGHMVLLLALDSNELYTSTFEPISVVDAVTE